MGRDLVEYKPMRRKSERHRTSRSKPTCLRIEPLERKSCPAAMLTISLAEPVVLEGEDVTCYVTLTEPARVTERVYLTMANKTASKYTQKKLSNEEMNALIGQLFASSNPNFSPNGEEISKLMTEDYLINLFKF